ncbi:MAG: thiazole synthase [Granulosicoccus sp.]
MTISFYDTTVESRLMLGTALYPSPQIMLDAIKASGTEIVTVSMRRESSSEKSGQAFWGLIKNTGCKVLPNTAGCHTVKEAVNTAYMARELFDTPWIKLEVIRDDDTLQPEVFALVEAARTLIADGFQVFPYTTDDLSVADKLLHAGCKVLMPWGAPIGSGRGLNNTYALRSMRAHFADIPLVVDAGIGVPSHACQALEMGYDAILLNTAVAKAGDPVLMAAAFAQAMEAGCKARQANPILARDMASPSTPVAGTPFWSN